MTNPTETTFLQALEICQSLVVLKCKPSSLPCQAIELFCEVGKEPSVLMSLIEKYQDETQKAFTAVWEYAVTLDNWRIDDCSLGFGVKDHCSILSFFLNIQTQKFNFFTGNWTPESICELLKDWKGIDLKVLLSDSSILASRLSPI